MLKKILLIMFVGLIFSSAIAPVFSATYDQLLIEAAKYDEAGNLAEKAAKYIKEKNGGVDTKEFLDELYKAQGLWAKAEDARKEAEKIGPGGRTADPADSGIKAPGSASASYAPPQDFKTYNLIVPIPGLSSQTITNPLEYIKGIYNFAVGFGVLVAVAVIIFAGIKWATSAGSVSATGEAKDMILNAVYGLAMLLGAILILSTISPSLTKLSLPNLADIGKQDYDYAAQNIKWAEINRGWKKAKEDEKIAREKRDALIKICDDLKAKGKECTSEQKIAMQESIVATQKAIIGSLLADLFVYANQLDLRRQAYTKALKDESETIASKISFGGFDRGEAAPAVIEADAAVKNAQAQYDDAAGKLKLAEDFLAILEKQLAEMKATQK